MASLVTLMEHLTLLVLCWIFVAVAGLADSPHPDTGGDSVSLMGSAFLFGTLIWLALEGAYYLAVTYVF